MLQNVLQNDTITAGAGAVLMINTALLLKLSFQAGKWAETLEDVKRRLTEVEGRTCPHTECPLRLKINPDDFRRRE